MKVTLYSRPPETCYPCRFTKRMFDEAGLDYTEVRVDEDPAAAAYVQSLGYLSAPVVEVDFGDGQATWHWSGLSTTQINLLTKKIAA